MSKVQIQAAVDTKVFLTGAAQMKISELEVFVRELNTVIFQKKVKDKTYRQQELLRLINQTVLPKEKREQYWELAEKLELDSISEKEHQIFLQLTEEEELLRNERVKMLLELSQLKNISLAQLMDEMGLKPMGHG